MEQNRLKALAGIKEAEIVDKDFAQEQDEQELDALTGRQKKIERLIRFALSKEEIPYDRYETTSVMYDERSERTATVEIDGDVSLDVLKRFEHTGLSNAYILNGSRSGISVTFSVSPDLDHAIEEVPSKKPRW